VAEKTKIRKMGISTKNWLTHENIIVTDGSAYLIPKTKGDSHRWGKLAALKPL
jgi:hypothetical protein